VRPDPVNRNVPGVTRDAAQATRDEAEAARVLRICNACRYCEGYCAVFPAMTRRLEFGKTDVNYMANLCHNCTACFHACQYAPPHEFDLNVPKALARVRVNTYAEYAWPRSFGTLYRNNGATLALALAAALALALVLILLRGGALFTAAHGGNFYAVLPHGAMVGLFGAVFGLAVLSLAIGGARFWQEVMPGPVSFAALIEALRNTLTLRYLDGGHGDGCNEADDEFTLARRRFHHFTFYGFMLCFAATAVGTLYHYVLQLDAPYGPFSLPVILGSLGGLGLLIGPAGLLSLNRNRHPEVGEPAQQPMDRGFIVLLLATSITGFALLVARATSLMPLLLAVHLGVVLAFFATAPFGKLAHAVYRMLALLMFSIERRQPNPLRLGSD
jgi:citrate/tricarballylate utilization protein